MRLADTLVGARVHIGPTSQKWTTTVFCRNLTTELANLADQREALLHAIREGVVAVGTDGRVESGSMEVVTSSHPEFALVGIQAVELMRFSPALVGGRPVRVSAELPIIFQIGY